MAACEMTRGSRGGSLKDLAISHTRRCAHPTFLSPERDSAYPHRSGLGRDRRGGFLHHRDLDLAGLVTYGSIFVIDSASRRVHVVGSTPHPDEGFMRQVSCTLTATDEGHGERNHQVSVTN
jgi:hypothetical protein